MPIPATVMTLVPVLVHSFHEMTYDHFGPFLLETMLEALLWNALFRCADQTCIQTRISLVLFIKLINI